MKIKKHGDTYNKGAEDKKEKFKCENCGCEFTVEEDDACINMHSRLDEYPAIKSCKYPSAKPVTKGESISGD